MNKKEWQLQQGFDDETMAKISVFVPNGKIISITPIVIDKESLGAILASKEVKDK
jgi:hypothetical protein